MARTLLQLARFGLAVFGLLCWVVMFLAGTDVWHDVGSPDLWTRPGVPYNDLRVVLFAFYLLFIVLVAHLAATAIGLVRLRRTRRLGA